MKRLLPDTNHSIIACTLRGWSAGACHYCESSKCAHVSINEVTCYRTESTLMGCADLSPRLGVRCP